MKTLFIILVSAGLICAANAQEFRTPLVGASRHISEKGEPKISHPVPTGMFYLMSEYGFDALNPWADRSLGKGEEFLTQNIAAAEGNNDPEEKNKSFGGISLFGYLF